MIRQIEKFGIYRSIGILAYIIMTLSLSSFNIYVIYINDNKCNNIKYTITLDQWLYINSGLTLFIMLNFITYIIIYVIDIIYICFLGCYYIYNLILLFIITIIWLVIGVIIFITDCNKKISISLQLLMWSVVGNNIINILLIIAFLYIMIKINKNSNDFNNAIA